MQFGFRFQILLFTTSVRFQLRHWHTWHTGHSRLSSVGDLIRSKLPLNNIFLRGLAANNTTCVCVYKYFERLPHNAPDDRNPITLKYKTTDKIVLWAKISCSSCDPALSVHDNVNHHQDNTRDQHVNTSLDHS